MTEKKEYRRDYLGSADAHQIVTGKFDALIRSKLKDTTDKPIFMTPKMQRGVALEKAMIEQMAVSLGLSEINVEDTFYNDNYEYSHSTPDAWTEYLGGELWECKTSTEPMPKTIKELRARYPQYYSQMQKQMWDSGFGRNRLIWCQCSDDAEELPFDDEGMLPLDNLIIIPDPEVFALLEENCPLCWSKFETAKSGNSVSLVDVFNVKKALSVQKKLMDLEEKKKEIEKKHKEVREELYKIMSENEIVGYSDDKLTITMIASSIRKSVDTEKLKEAGLYEEYVKESPTKGYVKITLKKEED